MIELLITLILGGPVPVEATAYVLDCEGCVGITAPPTAPPGHEGTGTVPVVGRTIACPPEWAARDVIWLAGWGARRCEDRGGAIRAGKLDLFVADTIAARQFGRRTLLAWNLTTGGMRWRKTEGSPRR